MTTQAERDAKARAALIAHDADDVATCPKCGDHDCNHNAPKSL